MKRCKDAGITKDSSQEIEGLLGGKEKSVASGRFHLLMSLQPDGRRGYVLRRKPATGLSLPTYYILHSTLSEQDDMHGSTSRLHSTFAFLSFSFPSKRLLTALGRVRKGSM